MLAFHQNAKGYVKGQRVRAGEGPLPLDLAERFQVFHPANLLVAPGELLRITQNSKTADGKRRLHNGDIVRLQGFDEAGRLMTDKGVLAADFGHIAHGYTVTSHASQGTDVGRVFIAQSADSFAASSREQFYVSVSRGRNQAVIYTDDKDAMREAVCHTDERLGASELFPGERSRQINRQHQFAMIATRADHEPQHRESPYDR